MKSHTIAVLGLALFVAMPAAIAQDAEKTETLDQKIDRLVTDLGADGEGSYEVREQAQRELIAIGKPAIRALEKAAKSDDLEVSSRASEALQVIRKGAPSRAPKTGEKPRDVPRGGQPTPPDMDEMLKQIEKQLPEGFGKLFKDFFKDGQPKGGDKERTGDLFRPRVRTWTWQSGPKRGQLRPGQPAQGSALGMRTGPTPAVLRAQLEIPKLGGRVVNYVARGGHAEKVGIKLYDVVVAIDGRPVRRAQDLFVLEDKACKVELYRKAKLVTVQVPAPVKAKPKPGSEPAPKKDGKSGERKQRSF